MTSYKQKFRREDIHKERRETWLSQIDFIIKYCTVQNDKELLVEEHNACCLLYDYAELYKEVIKLNGGLYKDQSKRLYALYTRVKSLSIKEAINVE